MCIGFSSHGFILLDSLCIKQALHTRRYLTIQIKVIWNLAIGALSSHLSFYLVSLYFSELFLGIRPMGWMCLSMRVKASLLSISLVMIG